MKKDILIVVPSMRGGGAEKVILNLTKHLPRDKFNIYLVVINLVGPYVSNLPSDIEIINLKVKRVRYAFFSIIYNIWRYKPDIVFSTFNHLNRMLCLIKPLFSSKTKLIIRETSIVSKSKFDFPKYNFLNKSVSIKLYNNADLIICQSKFMKEDLINNHKISQNKICVIYNPIDIKNIVDKGNQRNPFGSYKGIINILAVGRLSNEKAFHRIVDAFPKLLSKKNDSILWILGEGKNKAVISNKAKALGIKENVKFCGFKKNPYRWMKNADLFVLSSLYEGLPNVLLEAIACRCPVVSLKHPGGTKEILDITNMKDRFVSELNWKNEWFERPSCKQLKKLKNNFGIDKIISKYTNVLLSVGDS